MDSVQILTFDEALALAGGGKRHLHLGNGFSIALRPDIFTYNALYSHAYFEDAPHLPKIFEALGTTDFEMVIRTLADTAKILDAYGDIDPALARRTQEDAAAIKNILVDAIAGRHPSRPYEISKEQYHACRRFLHHFAEGRMYTWNYDVLLYWALMNDEVDELPIKADDGFRAPENDPEAEYVTWQSYHKTRVHYLHGALHLFDAGHELQKYTWSRTDIPIVDQIRVALDEERYPLFVSEGYGNTKLTRIMHSGYLHKALRSLEEIGNNLFIFGHSLHYNDEHILRTIERSKVERLFVSLYDDHSTPDNQRIIKRAQAMQQYRVDRGGRQLVVNFFDAASAHVWG